MMMDLIANLQELETSGTIYIHILACTSKGMSNKSDRSYF